MDVDECQTKENKCQYLCVNTIGSHTCECPKGFVKHRNTCVDRDECAESFNICGPRGICVNDAGSFHCECKRGYRLNDEGTGCEDVDECGLGRCGIGACRNHVGGYRCGGGCPMGFNGFRGRCMDVNECARNPCSPGKQCMNSPGGYNCACAGGYQEGGDGQCDDINECSINGGTCSNGCKNFNGGFSCGCQNGSFKVGNSHCVSAQNGFQQFVPLRYSPGYNQGWNSGPISRPPQQKPAGNGRPYQAKCYGCRKDQRSRRQSMHRSRGRRDAEFGNYTMVDIDGNDPNDEIDENLPLEIILRHGEIERGQTILDLFPARSPLKDNIKYHITNGNSKGFFRIHQKEGHAKLHFDKRKHADLELGMEFFIQVKGISMLDEDVIDILTESVPTMKKDLKEPLKHLQVRVEIL